MLNGLGASARLVGAVCEIADKDRRDQHQRSRDAVGAVGNALVVGDVRDLDVGLGGPYRKVPAVDDRLRRGELGAVVACLHVPRRREGIDERGQAEQQGGDLHAIGHRFGTGCIGSIMSIAPNGPNHRGPPETAAQ